MAGLGDDAVDLVARQLAAFARLGALRDLDLQLVRVDQVIGGDAEAAGRDLLDRATARVTVRVSDVALVALAAFTGVAATTDAVHGDRQVFVRLGADGAEAHGAGGEALDDLGGRLDLVERHALAVGRKLPDAAQRDRAARLLVDELGVFLVALHVIHAHR